MGRMMRYFLTALLAILLFQPKIVHVSVPERADARFARLEMFFDRYQCPPPHYSYIYLQAADAYSLDYRLLPAISVRESTCGQYERFNNRWGWDSLATGFSSVPQGIEFLARQLAQAPRYRGQPLGAKLETYNPIPAYVGEVEHLMRQIDRAP